MMKGAWGTKEEFTLNSSEDYWKEIRLLIFKKCDYVKGYNLSMAWYKKINKSCIDASKFYRWACRYYIGVALWSLEKYKSALDYLDESLSFINEEIDEINTKIVMALCYQELKKNNIALKIYESCIEDCNKAINNAITNERYTKTKASLLHNIGELLKEESYIYESINTYKKVNVDNETIRGVIEGKIDNNYKLLFELYIDKNNYFKANHIINMIKNRDMKQILECRMYNRQISC